MQISQQENGNFVLSGLESPMLEILLAIPESASLQGDLAAERRFFPAPSNDAEVNEEWREYVQPGLEEWFKSATDTVHHDLKELASAGDEGSVSLTIPVENIDPWLNALNQARLALATRHNITDEDMERPTDSELASPREVALFQIHFYAFIQECLLQGEQ